MAPHLTAKQRRFVQEYLQDLNATQAAIRAGYSAKTANKMVGRLLVNVGIQQAIQAAMDRRATRLELSTDRVLQEIARLAFVDVRRFYEADGRLKALDTLDDDTAAALAGLEVVEEVGREGDGTRVVLGLNKKVKTWNKVAALELAGKHLKLFVERKELTGKDGAALLEPSLLAALTQAEHARNGHRDRGTTDA